MENNYVVGDMISNQEEIASLFNGTVQKETSPEEETPEIKENPEITEEVETETPESVGNEEKNNPVSKEEESPEQNGSSPKIYSSIASLMRDDGTLPDLTDDEIKEIVDGQSLYAAVNKHVHTLMDERQQRVDDALNAGLEPTLIQQYENIIGNLENITEEQLTAEGTEGESLRKSIIKLEFTSKNFSNERAEKEANKAMSAGTDIDDSKEYLENLKSYYRNKYKEEVDKAKAEQDKQAEQTKKNMETLKNNIMDSKRTLFGELEVDATTRKKAFDALTKPVYRDNDGNYMTTVNKYIKEHPLEFQENVGLIFQLTDGFKNLGGLLKGKIRKEKNKAISELESAIQNTQRTSSGNINFFGSDSNSNFRGMDFDV